MLLFTFSNMIWPPLSPVANRATEIIEGVEPALLTNSGALVVRKELVISSTAGGRLFAD